MLSFFGEQGQGSFWSSKEPVPECFGNVPEDHSNKDLRMRQRQSEEHWPLRSEYCR